MQKFYTVLLLLVFITVFGQTPDFTQIDKEVRSLTTHEAVQSYWLTIYTDDQNNNGAGTEPHNEAIDVVNLYKAAVLIKKFGYPVNSKYAYPAPVVPWVVWTHCNYPEIKEYTIPIILMAKELNQLPEGMYPNYFVGGLLLDIYGLDMEYDPDFNKGEMPAIAMAAKYFESTNHTIIISKLKRIIKSQMDIYDMKVSKTLGTWKILQFDSNIVFKIMLLEDNNWYLSTQSNSNEEILRRVITNKDLKIFEPYSGFGLFYFTIDSTGNLHLKNCNNEVVKVLKRE